MEFELSNLPSPDQYSEQEYFTLVAKAFIKAAPIPMPSSALADVIKTFKDKHANKDALYAFLQKMYVQVESMNDQLESLGSEPGEMLQLKMEDGTLRLEKSTAKLDLSSIRPIDGRHEEMNMTADLICETLQAQDNGLSPTLLTTAGLAGVQSFAKEAGLTKTAFIALLHSHAVILAETEDETTPLH
ncbi:hypothetical protein HA050_12015 [Iodobacter sp. HSC-16F04]|uniref:Uncharacterized protein n=1 Tax=Iodobacter violaceini TaxID=3044271 RepID=A0ABX0KSY1_9NEIS|nr:hypothetical protein [Iodobacter violacea]NHQ86844.1 hypothetical protein [Iodobacter violacea]